MKMTFKIALIAGTLGIVTPIVAQTNPPAVSGGRIAFAATDYDFGKVDSGTLVKHDFIFTNAGDKVLEVTAVRPSCGCTSAGDWDKKVGPGKTGKIPIQFNSSGYGGTVHKTVYVTCSDPTRPSVTLNLQGTIWKAIDVSPVYAVFNLRAEGQESQTQAVKIVNNTDEPITVSDPTCGNPAFNLALKTVHEGKEFELRVSVIPSQISGTLSAPITLKTSLRKMPQISVTAFAMMQPLLTATPPQVMLPAGPLTQAAQFTVAIQNNGTNSIVLSDPKINASGADVQLTERLAGRQYNLTLSFPIGFQGQSGVQATVKTSSRKYPLVTIPVFQPASHPMTSIPVPSPAPTATSSSIKPMTGIVAPVALRK